MIVSTVTDNKVPNTSQNTYRKRIVDVTDKVKSRDNLQSETNLLLVMIQLELIRESFKRKYKILSPSFTVYFYLLTEWIFKGKGHTAYSICVALGKTGESSNVKIKQLVYRLMDKGLTEVIEKNGQSYVFAPSDKGIKEFKTLLKGIRK